MVIRALCLSKTESSNGSDGRLHSVTLVPIEWGGNGKPVSGEIQLATYENDSGFEPGGIYVVHIEKG